MRHALRAAGQAGPLAGARVLLTRRAAGDRIATALEEAGAEVVAVALTETVPGDCEAMARAQERLASGAYAWVVVTSARAPAAMSLAGAPASTRFAAVGPGTARALEESIGRRADIVADGGAAGLLREPLLAGGPESSGAHGESTQDASSAERPEGRGRLLLPASAIADPALADGLGEAGWLVEAVPAYSTRTAPADSLPPGLTRAWGSPADPASGGFDVVVLLAGSGARALHELLGPPPARPASMGRRTAVVALGPSTAAEAARLGLGPDAVADSPTPHGVLSAVSAAVSNITGPRSTRPHHAPTPEEPS
ncbi:uroporphyrinogen-III synthase [Actinomyces gaoshouyii]|uniref:Uroporphyrinogen-III synthase n=1 Tax=Actinomyces gaoshouyii TaxID=1960083 RepID=A0A8H9HBQ6_9ACTO|nr:uroporphyrinogen-III synthase [Actinomyces gaoshouyii]GGO95286.1 uroporphyrinogen III methyltransferase [Actinomyces gaoshouyii]